MTPLGIVLHLVTCVSINLVVIGTSRYHWNFAISRVLGDPSYLLDYSDSDAGWNSTQHPTWPQALGEEFTPDVKDLWMGLRCLYIYIYIYTYTYRYWGTYMNMLDAEPQPWKWTNDWVLCAWNNGMMLGGKFPNTKGMLGGNLGDAGWKLYEEVRRQPKYLNWEFFANIKYYNNSVSRNRAVPFIHWDTFQHTRFSCGFLQMLQLIPK